MSNGQTVTQRIKADWPILTGAFSLGALVVTAILSFNKVGIVLIENQDKHAAAFLKQNLEVTQEIIKAQSTASDDQREVTGKLIGFQLGYVLADINHRAARIEEELGIHSPPIPPAHYLEEEE